MFRGVYSPFLRVSACFFMVLMHGGSVVRALSSSTGPNGTNAQAVHALGHTGEGVHIGFISYYNVFKDHFAFCATDIDGNPIPESSRVLVDNAAGIGLYEHAHDTQMAGIMVSAGDLSEPNQIGLAPGAELHNTRAIHNGVFFCEAVLEKLVVHRNCRVIVTGFQVSGVPESFDGSHAASLMYDYYAYNYNVVFANAAGNYRQDGYPCFSPPTSPGDAYNGITTGGLVTPLPDVYDRIGAHSLAGPTYDGRRKPEAAAPSFDQRVPTYTSARSPTAWDTTVGRTQGFTSWAVPHTAGIAALLLGFADTTDEPHDGRSEVIKAVIVNSAFPNINDRNGGWTAPSQSTWHPHRGYGRLDALRAFETLSAPRVYACSPVIATQRRGWAYDVFDHDSFSHTYSIEGIENGRLVTTVTWHRKVSKQADGYTPEDPVLNLAVRIFNPEGYEIFSESGDGNNLRKADLFLCSKGVYSVQVAIDITLDPEERGYALAFEVLEPLAGDWNSDYIVDEGDLAYLFDRWLANGGEDDLSAFGILSSQWLRVDLRYRRP